MIELVLTILIVVIIAIELWGVSRSRKGEVDTISEIYWKWRNKLPTWAIVLVNIGMTAFLIWAIFHFLGYA